MRDLCGERSGSADRDVDTAKDGWKRKKSNMWRMKKVRESNAEIGEQVGTPVTWKPHVCAMRSTFSALRSRGGAANLAANFG